MARARPAEHTLGRTGAGQHCLRTRRPGWAALAADLTPLVLIDTVARIAIAVTVCVLLLPGTPNGVLPAFDTGYTAVSWGGSVGSQLFISLLISLALSELPRRLEKSLAQLNNRNDELLSIMQERESLQEQVLRSQKQSALGTMVAGVTHDFNNLLLPKPYPRRELLAAVTSALSLPGC